MNINAENVKNFGTILGIWAHPDDESWNSAGIALCAQSLGNRYVAIFATMGELGIQDPDRWPPQELASIRERELKKALKVLHIDEYYLLHYPDGGLQYQADAEPVSRIAEIIREVQPDTVLTFEPGGLTGHDDHKTVSKWTSAALKQVALPSPANLLWATRSKEWYDSIGRDYDTKLNVFYDAEERKFLPKSEIDYIYELPAKFLDLKLTALQAQESQYFSMFKTLSPAQLQQAFGTEEFLRGT